MIDDVQHYNVSTDMGVPCLILQHQDTFWGITKKDIQEKLQED